MVRLGYGGGMQQRALLTQSAGGRAGTAARGRIQASDAGMPDLKRLLSSLFRRDPYRGFACCATSRLFQLLQFKLLLLSLFVPSVHSLRTDHFPSFTTTSNSHALSNTHETLSRHSLFPHDRLTDERINDTYRTDIRRRSHSKV